MKAKMEFQRPAPKVVYSKKVPSFMRARPAGMDINWRTAGIRRPTKVDTAPCLSKYSSAWLHFGFVDEAHVPETAVGKLVNDGASQPFCQIVVYQGSDNCPYGCKQYHQIYIHVVIVGGFPSGRRDYNFRREGNKRTFNGLSTT